MKEGTQREREIMVTVLCSLYRMNRGGKSETEYKPEITNSTNFLTNLISTRGKHLTDTLSYKYTNGSRLTKNYIHSKLNYSSLVFMKLKIDQCTG